MKRHKYSLPKYLKNLTMIGQQKLLALKYIREQDQLPNPALQFSARTAIQKIHPHMTKINTYCLVTGRVHYTVKSAYISRQTFYEYCGGGFLPGYYFA